MIDWAGRLPRFPADCMTGYRAAGLWGARPIADEFRATAARQAASTANRPGLSWHRSARIPVKKNAPITHR